MRFPVRARTAAALRQVKNPISNGRMKGQASRAAIEPNRVRTLLSRQNSRWNAR